MAGSDRPAHLLAVVVAVAAAVLGSGTGAALGGSAPAPGATPVPPVVSTTAVTVAPAFVSPTGVRDLGPVGPGTAIDVVVGLASRDPAGLAAFVNASAVPGTPLYRQFLPAAAADARFGALPATVAAAESYFQGFGLSTSVHPDGLLLSVIGPGPAVARAFGTTFDAYRSGAGATFIDHPTAATLPGGVPWTGAFGLATIPALEPEVVPAVAGAAPVPAAGCPVSGNGLTPCQVATAYDLAGLQAAGTNGSGERIAVIDAYSSAENQSDLASDYATFARAAGLPTSGLSFAYPVPTTADLNASGTNPEWSYEDALDPEWAHAAAPGASIEVVYSPNSGAGLYAAIDWVVAEGAADVLSMSWGEPEVGIFNASTTPCAASCNASTDGSFAVLDPVLELAAAEGISAFAASGDCGAADGTSGVAVNYPASDPFVTGVGATDLTLTESGTYGGEVGWSGNASGATPPGCENQGGSGGGYSVLPRPWWQVGEGTVPSAGRGVPDVAMVGGLSSPVVIVYQGGAVGVAGTSVGTPIWAGIAATVDQAVGTDLGWLNPGLYRILRGPNYTADFHEVVAGANGYTAHPGWNPVTGIGTPIVGNLSRDLARTPVPLSNLTTFVYASPRFGPAPLTVGVATEVRGGSGAYALEGVDFGDGISATVVAGTASHTFAAPGVYSVQAYVVDSSGNVSASPPVVVVVGGGGPLAVELNASTTGPAVGAGVTFTASATGASGPFLYNFSFGDGTFADNLSAGTVAHAYAVAGSFCAEVVVRTVTAPPDGAASLRRPIAVGGAAAPACGNPAQPLTLTPNASEGVRDAPADFPSPFTSSGGSTAPGGLAPQVGLASRDPYTAACDCAILRQAGTYTLQEWENDSVGEEATASVEVTVAPPLQATFAASTLSGPAPLSVTFSSTASGGVDANASSTHWRLGNGENATGDVVHAVYPSPGEYVAVASLSDLGDGNASEAFLLDVQGPVPSVGLTGTVTPAVNVSSGTTVAWAATPLGPSGELAGTTVEWTLGRGGGAFGRFANETYSAPADAFAGDQLNASVAVVTPALTALLRVPIPLSGFFATEAGGFVPAADALAFVAQVTPETGLVPLAVTAVATVTGPGGVAVNWTFGDGGSSHAASVGHVYFEVGDYTVRVEATDGFGDSAAGRVAIVASAALTLAGCGASWRYGTAPYTLRLAPSPSGGTGPPYSFRWTLPNGTGSTAANLTLTFASPGTYDVGLVVTDPTSATFGCSWAIVVSAVPPVAFLDVVAGGVGAGVVLAVVFVVATRPTRPKGPPGVPPDGARVSP